MKENEIWVPVNITETVVYYRFHFTVTWQINIKRRTSAVWWTVTQKEYISTPLDAGYPTNKYLTYLQQCISLREINYKERSQ